MPFMFSFEAVYLKKYASSFFSAYLLSVKKGLGFPGSPFVEFPLKS